MTTLALLAAAGLSVSPACAANKASPIIPAIGTVAPLAVPEVKIVTPGGAQVALPQVDLGASLPASVVHPAIPLSIGVQAREDKPTASAGLRAEAARPEALKAAGPVNGENDKQSAGKLFEGSGELPSVDVGVPAGTAQEPGALTLEKLDAFTLTGPRPAERGLPFLLAQGAKAVSDTLAQAWRSFKPAPRRGGQDMALSVGTIVRRDGRTSVIVPRENAKPLWVDVPAKMAQGIVTNSLVEVEYSNAGDDYRQTAASLRPIGTQPMDMMIGRVVDRGGRLMVESLFKDNGAPTSGYEAMALTGAPAKPGTIVQAFVSPVGGAFQAAVLVELGTQITPEIAAREAALRQGGRGHMEKGLIAQAEAAGRDFDAAAEFVKVNARLRAAGRPEAVDYRKLSFLTIDPIGAGDLDDAYHVVEHADGSSTWYLATADVARLVRPGSEGFRSAIGKGNTFYSIDKDGVPEYPMIHPMISKDKASLIGGQDRMAVMTTMRFGPDGEFLQDESSVGLGLVRVQGRYTYDQVVRLWEGKSDHGITHLEQIALARKLAQKLDRRDAQRGKLQFSFLRAEPVKRADGWHMESVRETPLAVESHRLIEELKVYGNRVIARRLSAMTKKTGVPHISRVHQPQDEKKNRSLRQDLQKLGVPWNGGTVSEYLLALQKREDLSPELKDVAQVLVLSSRATAKFSAEDGLGHEGLALGSDEYDQPSAGIRRAADLINLVLLEAELEGQDPRAVYAAMTADFKALGLKTIEQVAEHLSNRQTASKQMGNEVRDFMSLYELAKPEHWNKPLKGYVSFARMRGRSLDVTIQLREPAVTVKIGGLEGGSFSALDEVEVVVTGADLGQLRLDRTVRKIGGRDERSRRGRRGFR